MKPSRVIMVGTLLLLATVFLCACTDSFVGNREAQDPSKEDSEMNYEDLTAEDLALLETVNMPAEPGKAINWRQAYILTSCQTMSSYLHKKYPELSFVICGFNRAETNAPCDRMYVTLENGSDQDQFTVFLDADGLCRDDYATVYARPAFDAMILQPLEEKYGAENVKSHSALYQKEDCEPDISLSGEELLQTGMLVGDSVLVINANGTGADEWLSSYIRTFAEVGIPMQLSIEYATPSGFASVTDDTIGSFWNSPQMTARYLCNSTSDGKFSVRIID